MTGPPRTPDDGPDRPAPVPPPGPTQYGDPGPGLPPHVYNPYGDVAYPASYPVPPAGLGAAAPPPARRPGSVHLALALLLLSVLPYLLIGLLAFSAAGNVEEAVPPDALPPLPPGVDLEQLVRTTGIVLLGVALVFGLLAVLAWTGRAWARALATAMVGGFVLMVIASAAGAAAVGPTGLLVLAVPLVLAAAGVALLFGSAARAWFSRPRR